MNLTPFDRICIAFGAALLVGGYGFWRYADSQMATWAADKAMRHVSRVMPMGGERPQEPGVSLPPGLWYVGGGLLAAWGAGLLAFGVSGWRGRGAAVDPA